MKPAKRRGRQTARDVTTEDRILNAAHAVFVRSGTAGARMHQIAKEAGVNAALLHYYFRTKDRLAEAVFQRTARALLPAIIRILESDAEIEEKVSRVIDLELAHLSRAPYLPMHLISELAHHPARVQQLVSAVFGGAPDSIGRRVQATLGRQIRARVRARTMHPIEPDQFIVNLMSLCVFPFAARPLLKVLLDIDEPAFHAFIARRRVDLAAFFLRGLRP
jgi:TetR/AcrR family transcriptional regulator